MAAVMESPSANSRADRLRPSSSTPSPSPRPRGPTIPTATRPIRASYSLHNHAAAIAAMPSSASPWKTPFGPPLRLHFTSFGFPSSSRSREAHPQPLPLLRSSDRTAAAAPARATTAPVHRRRTVSSLHHRRRDLGEAEARGREHLPTPTRLQVPPPRRRRSASFPPVRTGQTLVRRYVIK
ncbi:hypothetical protein U9M48_008640 [Paspalum notatum var. saurae]|uniref:Uncharacterized protein n=1 Tax=Paspalum notatum var. saurae TaxID=547442 RepID=A0AAQ3WE00_PASNO